MTHEQPAPRPPRYWSLDIFRGVCAGTVFLNHWPLWSQFNPTGAAEGLIHASLSALYRIFTNLTWPTGGQHPALIGFFVLSGFCVHFPFEWKIGRPGKATDWREYFIRRIRRIMPVFWIGALLGLTVVAAEHWRPTGDGLLQLHTTVTPLQVAVRLSGLSGLWPEEIFAGNYILHTVGTEILIYAVYPLFFLAAVAGRWWLLGAIAVGLQVLAVSLLSVIDPFVLFPGVLMMALFWYLGALAAHLVVKGASRIPGWVVAALWGFFLALQFSPHFFGLGMIKQLAWGFVCMAVIVWLIGWEGRNGAKRDHPLARFLCWTGDISYPLYAVHTPVILLVNWSLLTFGASRSYALQLTLNLLLSVLIAAAVHYGIERRFYRPKVTA